LLAEKKSLKRFILVYLLSTLFLIGIGEYFYYKNQLKSIKEAQLFKLDSKLKLFIANNKPLIKGCVGFDSDINLKSANLDIAIFGEKKLIASNFKIKKIDFSKKYWFEDNFLYYLFKMPKKEGIVYVVTREKFNNQKIVVLKRYLLTFNIFVIIFIFLVAWYLGKLFIKPLKDVIKNLESFIRDATHEMNTPISVILNNIEMLRIQGFDKKEFKRIEFSTKRLEKIFKDLAFVKLNHKSKKEIVRIDLKELIKQRVSIFTTFIENKNIKLKLNLKECFLDGDIEDINRLVDNILSNAFKYSLNGQSVEIYLTKNFLKVKNRGHIKDLKNVTSKFYRENNSEGGFGLGLFIVKKICQMYNYKLKIESKNNNVEVTIGFT
jgi:two-component system OmpR family sensor kinase